VKWQFKGKTPGWAKILARVLVLNILLQIATVYWFAGWAPIQTDPVHFYRIRVHGVPTYFVQPWLGSYSDYGLYLGFVLLALFAVLLWVNRDQLERIP
jgi:hypothetical protein